MAVRLWSVTEPQRPAETLDGASSTAIAVTFTPDGRHLAAGLHGGAIRLWEVARPREPPQKLEGHAETVAALEVSPNGRFLASAGLDQSVRVWDITDPAGETPEAHVLTGHTNTVLGLSFSPDGKRLASGGLDHSVRLWSLEDGDAPTAFGRPLLLGPALGAGITANSDVTGLDYAPDGRHVAITCSDRTVRVWDLEPQTLVDRVCRTAAGNLTERTWQQYFGNQSYEELRC